MPRCGGPARRREDLPSGLRRQPRGSRVPGARARACSSSTPASCCTSRPGRPLDPAHPPGRVPRDPAGARRGRADRHPVAPRARRAGRHAGAAGDRRPGVRPRPHPDPDQPHRPRHVRADRHRARQRRPEGSATSPGCCAPTTSGASCSASRRPGSDLAALRTTAVRDGDDWVVNGQKVWTTLAHVADYGILLTRTDPDRPKHAGLTMFVVDMHAPGVTVRPLRQMAGGSGFNEVFFDDVRIPDSERLGEPGEGWRVALTTLMNERVAIGGAGTDLGVSVEALAAHARDRLPALAARPAGARPAGGGPGGRRSCWPPGTPATGASPCSARAGCPGPRPAPASSPAPPPRGSPPTPGCGCSATTPSTPRRPTATTPGSAPRPTCPGWRSPAAPTRCCATSSASGCWACRRNRAPTRRGRSPGGAR